MTVFDAVMDAIAPLVGRPAATICLRSSAIRLGKTAEELCATDLPAIVEDIRASMRPFTTMELLESAIVQIKNSPVA